ncbi:MAG: hypothetical protein KKI08_23135 [Armatimonadetes bacterium]|nr:hypothetical protein [Armatimonadota bacterium]
MRKLLCLTFPILVICSVLCAQGEARLANWTYQTDSRYLADAYVDKTGAMLSDGDTKKLVIYATGGTVINIDLAEQSRLTGVAVNVTRPNNNYKLREVRVQADVFGNWRDLGQVAGFWGDTKERTFRLEVPDLDVTTSKVRLVFNNPSVLSVAEIELFGQAVTQQVGAQLQAPFVNNPKPSAREQDLDKDGKPEIILENDQVRLIFAPLVGGACRSFVLKPAQQEFALSQSPGYGLLRDQLWAPAYMFADRPYSWQLGGDANTAWAELSVTGAGGMMSFTTLTKRVEITRGSPVVRVHYKLLNDPSSQTDYTYGFWVHNFMGVLGQPMRYFIPTEEGVQELPFPTPKGEKQSDYWWKDPARGWTAVCGENSVGLATQADYKFLNCFYEWAGTGYPAATHEWRYNRLPLKSGQAFETNVTLTPFTGLKRVDGVVGDVIGGIDPGSAGVPPAQAVIKLLPASGQTAAATGLIRLRQLPSGAWQDLGKIEMAAGKPAEQQVKLGDLAPGAYVLNVQVQRGGKTLDDFERAFSVGGAQIAYHREPLEQRVGMGAEEKVSLPRHDLSDAIVTPHMKWATPLPGGPIKALVLCDDFVAREVIELKQRLQMDLTYVKFRTTFWTEDLYCGDRTISTPEQANKRLQDALKATKFDVLLISGFNWGKHFAPASQQAIMAEVKAGAGLVLIEPDGFAESDELAPIAGIAKTRAMHAFSRWQRGEQSPLTAGLPWDTMPVTRYMDYTKWPEGKVLATLDKGQPLLVTNQFGEGRTAVLTYDTLTHDMSYRGYAGLIPIFSYRGGFLRDEYNNMTGEYWEPYYALLARLSVWAAKRDTGVETVSLEPLADHEYGQPATLPLRLSGGAGEYAVTATFENRCGQPVQEVKAGYKAGQGEVALPVPPFLPAGLNTVNVIVKDRAGAHVAWGQTTVTGTTPVAIKSLAPEKNTLFGTRPPRGAQLFDQAFSCEEPAKLTVTLDLRAQMPGLQLQARLYDTYRRLLFEETRPLGGNATETFTAPLPELRSQGLQWEVSLPGPQGQLDFATCRVLCVAPRDWDHFRLTNWGGIFTWRSEYLNDILGELVAPMVDISFGGLTENSTGKTWLNLWHNIGYSDLGLLSYMGKDVPDFMERSFSEKATQYAQTKDKQYLVRTPSLADREWRAKVMENMVKRATDDVQQFGGAYDYCMGDEMSLTHYTRYFDFDFDPRNLADFRAWLKGRYPDLAALNKAWATSFATWDDVMPMTLDEARQAANAARGASSAPS